MHQGCAAGWHWRMISTRTDRVAIKGGVLEVRLGLGDTVEVALQQLNAGEGTVGQTLLNIVHTGLLKLEPMAGAHGEQGGSIGTQTGEVIGIGVSEDLGRDESVDLLGGGNSGAGQGQAAHERVQQNRHGVYVKRSRAISTENHVARESDDLWGSLIFHIQTTGDHAKTVMGPC